MTTDQKDWQRAKWQGRLQLYDFPLLLLATDKAESGPSMVWKSEVAISWNCDLDPGMGRPPSSIVRVLVKTGGGGYEPECS